MADVETKSPILPLFEEWDVDPEVSSLVYYPPKGCKQLQEVNL